MDTVRVNVCINKHHFLDPICPYCKEEPLKTVTYNVGDCIKCGEICLAGLYCCHSPEPMKAKK